MLLEWPVCRRAFNSVTRHFVLLLGFVGRYERHMICTMAVFIELLCDRGQFRRALRRWTVQTESCGFAAEGTVFSASASLRSEKYCEWRNSLEFAANPLLQGKALCKSWNWYLGLPEIPTVVSLPRESRRMSATDFLRWCFCKNMIMIMLRPGKQNRLP